jgi:hypothetical protein
MASINASTSGPGGIITSGDATGNLSLQTAGTTAVTLDTSQNATFAGKVTSAGALTLASNGSTTAVTIDASQNTTFAGTVTLPTGVIYPIVSGTSQASTSGTTITFTDIPSWAKRVTMIFSGVSLSGSDNFLVQVGSGTFTTSGYSNITGFSGLTTGTITSTSGISIASGGVAGDLTYGQITFYNITGNTWVASGATTAGTVSNYFSIPGGSVSLSGVLDRIRVTTIIGTDTFDAGTINILYE